MIDARRGFDFPVNDSHLPVFVDLSCFVCDAPARAFVKQIKLKGHNAYWGCGKCMQRGSWLGKMMFPEVGARLRTDEAFQQGAEENNPHHNGPPSPLLQHLGIKMVTQFPFDYMHMVCLGVMRRLLSVWLKSPVSKRLRIGQLAISQISAALKHFEDYIPKEFSRKCRGLAEVDRWKATEFRQFLLFSGVVSSKLSQALYDHFLILFIAIHCLASPVLFDSFNEYAHNLLCRFVDQAKHLYGEDFLVYNIHGLTHLAADVRNFGPLDAHSAFPFENFLRHLKQLVHKPHQPLQQVVRRICEKSQQGVLGCRANRLAKENKHNVRKEHMRGPVPGQYAMMNCVQFQQIEKNGWFLSVSKGDNCAKVNNAFFFVRNVLCVDGVEEEILVLQRFNRACDCFQYPYQSSRFDIVRCDQLSNELETAYISHVQDKLVALPYKESFVLFPLNVVKTFH